MVWRKVFEKKKSLFFGSFSATVIRTATDDIFTFCFHILTGFILSTNAASFTWGYGGKLFLKSGIKLRNQEAHLMYKKKRSCSDQQLVTLKYLIKLKRVKLLCTVLWYVQRIYMVKGPSLFRTSMGTYCWKCILDKSLLGLLVVSKHAGY